MGDDDARHVGGHDHEDLAVPDRVDPRRIREERGTPWTCPRARADGPGVWHSATRPAIDTRAGLTAEWASSGSQHLLLPAAQGLGPLFPSRRLSIAAMR